MAAEGEEENAKQDLKKIGQYLACAEKLGRLGRYGRGKLFPNDDVTETATKRRERVI